MYSASKPRVEQHSLKPSPSLATPKNAESGARGTFAANQNDAVPQASAQVEVEQIAVRPSGFEPREIIRPHGLFMLAVSNQTSEPDLVLRIDRLQGNRVQEIHLPKGRIRWNKAFELPPGDYVLSEQNHADWLCHLKLTAE